jgi:hypothetical protein
MLRNIVICVGLDLSSAGNCVGYRCSRNAHRIQGIPEEEVDFLEYLEGSRNHSRAQEIVEDQFVFESSLSQEVSVVNLDTHTEVQNSTIEERTIARENPHPVRAERPGVIQCEYLSSIRTSLPPRGFIFEVMSGDTTIRKIDLLDVVEVSKKSIDGKIQRYLSRVSMLSDCQDNHLVDRLLAISDVLIPLHVSPPYILTVGGTYVDYDHLRGCHRTRRAIVWETLNGFVSITALRRGSPDKLIPPRKAFEITRMILDMINRIHKAGVSHGRLTPLNVWVGNDRTVVMNLQGAGFTRGNINRDLESVFQILIDMNPGIYTRYTIKPINDKEVEFRRMLEGLRGTLMGLERQDDYISRHTTARGFVDSLLSMS